MGNSSEVLEFDTVIIGAGLIGSSVAMHLSQFAPEQRIALLDLDFVGTWSSSELNAGGVRATWNQAINVELSQHSIHYFQANAESLGYHPCGYLWLYQEEQWQAAQARAERLRQVGLEVAALSPRALSEHAPFLDKLDGVAGATFSPHDGLFNPNLLKLRFREQARTQGVTFLDRHRVHSAVPHSRGMELSCFVERELSDSELLDSLSDKRDPQSRAATEVKIRAVNIVNCTGAWANRLAAILGYETATRPLRRQACVFSCRGLDLRKYGMIVDTSGVYFHPEADNVLAGWADPAEPEGFRLQYDGSEFFEEKIWLPLYERSSAFESLKHITGWAGLYEMTPDHSGIVGAVPGKQGLFEAHGFSGHGAMQSYSVGLALAEKIHFSDFRTVDCKVLSGERFAKGELIDEGMVI